MDTNDAAVGNASEARDDAIGRMLDIAVRLVAVRSLPPNRLRPISDTGGAEFDPEQAMLDAARDAMEAEIAMCAADDHISMTALNNRCQ